MKLSTKEMPLKMSKMKISRNYGPGPGPSRNEISKYENRGTFNIKNRLFFVFNNNFEKKNEDDTFFYLIKCSNLAVCILIFIYRYVPTFHYFAYPIIHIIIIFS